MRYCRILVGNGSTKIMSSELKGKVLTVLGPREPGELGVTLPHEQPLVDLTKLLVEPPPGYGHLRHLEQLEMSSLGAVRRFPYSVLTNLLLESEEDVLCELQLYRQAGGGTLCDVSPVGVRLKRESLPKISMETGLNIIAGTAFYVEPLMPEEVKHMTIQERSQFLIDEIEKGVSGCGVRCGFIGEIGCSSPLSDNERKSLQAAAIAQHKTGAPLMVHPGPTEEAPFEILDILESSGADVSHTVIAHLDRTIHDDQTLLRLAERGCYLEFDLFGTECSHYQLVPDIDFPNDAQKIQKVKLLIDNGHAHQVLISSDVHTKHRMARYGGHGFAHILEAIVPKLRERGITDDDVTRLITTNPQTWLTFR